MRRYSASALLRLWAISLLVVVFGLIGSSKPACALTFELDTEFDTGVTGGFSSVEIIENGGALNFSISLNLDLLGADSDLRVFYFNIVSEISGLAIGTTDAPVSDYVLTQNPPVAGGAGSNFDWGVDFGNGGGASGNGKLQSASFTLTADQNLVLNDLLESSWASGGSIEVQFAAHIQGTSALTGASSETIGGTIPEPSTGALVCCSLTLLAARSRWAGHSRTSTRVGTE